MKLRNFTLSYTLRITLTVIILLLAGLFMIYSASVSEAARDFGNKWHFVILQLKWAIIGLGAMLGFSLIKPSLWEKFSPWFMLAGLVLLLLVLIPGLGSKVQGARRWLMLPGLTLQPSELIKFLQVLYLSSWLSKRKISFLQLLAYLGVVGGLIMLQPDMGTTIVVVVTTICLYFLAGYPFIHVLQIIAIGAIMALALILAAPYRLARVATFFNPEAEPLGSSYHIRQVVIALGSGGMTGVGIGKSRQKYEYLPESTTDSIFAVVGEELGFIGGLGLIASFVYLITLLFQLSTRVSSQFRSLVVSGVGSWIAVQVILNLAAMVAAIPLTGVPLPLVSYGGSALISIMMGLGLVLAIGREEKL